MTKTTLISAALLMASTALVSAAELALPAGSLLSNERHEGHTSQRLAIGPFTFGEVPSIWAEGVRSLEAWQTTTNDLTTLQFMAPLKDQLVEQGYEILFECRDSECGGFDFRYAQELLPEPDMHVNLADYRFISAQRMTEDLPEYVTLLVSSNRSRNFVHVTTIGAQAPVELVPAVVATKGEAFDEVEGSILPLTDIGSVLEKVGVAVLEDLNFEVGSSNLALGEFASLSALAEYLNANPRMTVTLVGHTDAVGSMTANVNLSKARAKSVRNQLVSLYGVSRDQVDAQGVGFLSPVASNLSEDGRHLNRRVEVVLTATN